MCIYSGKLFIDDYPCVIRCNGLFINNDIFPCNLACWVRYHKYDLEESLEEMIDQQPHAAKYIIAMNILMDDAEGSESPFEGNSFMTS